MRRLPYRFRHLRHKRAGHHHGRYPLLPQSILHGQCVHDGSQHTDFIGIHPVHLAARTAAPEIAAAYHNTNLGAQIVGRFDAGTDRGDGFLIKPSPFGTGERFSAHFEQDAVIAISHKNNTTCCLLWFCVRYGHNKPFLCT